MCLKDIAASNEGPIDVYVGYALLDGRLSERERRYYLEFLSGEERGRLGRYYFEEDRLQYLIAHGLLRTSLSELYGEDPGSWQFYRLESGKPCLATDISPMPKFSLTHTRGLVGCVIAPGVECGIDAESVTRPVDTMGLVEVICAESEKTYVLGARSSAERIRRFYRLWVLKEAYVKAKGTGLSFGVDRITFSNVDEEDIDCMVDGVPLCGWKFRLFSPAEDKYIATAVNATENVVNHYSCT